MTEKKTFEAAVGELEGIVRKIEGGSLTLDESLSVFEKGIALTRECEGLLSAAKARVEKVIRDANGNVGVENFEPKE